MALSQLQCLDDNHVNPRTHESKPEFMYSEDQRLALEAFLRDGREAFLKYLGAHGLRGFLSDPELEALAEAAEPYDPGSELFPMDAEDDEPPLSMYYWPELSDTSVPEMDLGWPDSISYRGVTRTTVYAQPPMEGQAHIKEVVRKMIAQAQKVIAVVMDVFTDVDIFRDLLDASFKRKVSVYILLEHTTLPHFRSMCQRADMHAGHLKNLRVRCTNGAEFYARSCTKVRGQMGHRFMFIDGDKAVSGSYSFTWMSSRLDRNLITVITGQAVETFDKLFRILYATSSMVDLRQIATEPEPVPEPLPQLATVAPPSAAIARKLYNPKYALVALGNPSPTPSADPKQTQSPEDAKSPETKKRRRRRASKEAIEEAPPTHPGLDLEKACLISYLPTWPEPDPPSDVIGFINIRDTKKPTQVHLQRSEMFEISQAVRFSSPFSMPQETLPEIIKPRQFTVKHVDINEPKPAQDKTKTEELVVGKAQAAQPNAAPGDSKSKAEASASGPKSESDKNTIKTLNTENQLRLNTHTNQDANHNSTPHLNAHTPHQSNGKASSPKTERPLHTVQTATNHPESNTKKETNSNSQRGVMYRTVETSSTQVSHLRRPTDSNSNSESHTQSQNSSEITPNVKSHMSSSATSATSENNHVLITTSTSTSALSPLSSISSSSTPPPLTSSSTTLNPPLPSPSSLAQPPPIPKPRTVQLIIKGGVTGDGQKLPEFNVVRRPEVSRGLPVVHNEPTVATLVQTKPEKVRPESVSKLQNDRGSKTDAQKDAEKTGKTQQPIQSRTSQEMKSEEQLVAGNNPEAQKSDVLISDGPKAGSVNIQVVIPKDVEPETLTSVDCKLTPQTEIKAPKSDFTEVPNEKSETMIEKKTYLARAHEPQQISYCIMTPQVDAVLESVDLLKAPFSGDNTPGTQGQQGHPSFSPALPTTSFPNTAKHNTHSTFQEQTPKARGGTHTPERPLRLHISDKHMPDLRSPERESWLLTALSPTLDGFLPRTPTPDSRTHTPDIRTPTPDGYVSALSTTSDEYYECIDSPSQEPVFERAASRNQGMMEDHVSFSNTSNATTITTSPTYMNYNSCAATDCQTSSGDTQSLSESSIGSSSSLLEREVKKENEENGREDDEKVRELSVTERRTEGEYEGTERRGSDEAKRTADHFKQGKDWTETEENNLEIQTPKRKRVLNQSASVDGEVTPGEITNKKTEPKRRSTGDLRLKTSSSSSSSEVKRSDKVVDKTVLGVERRDRHQPTRETEGQKLLHTPSKTRQKESGSSSPSRPSRPPRPLSANPALGPRPWASRQLSQADSKAVHNSFQVSDNISSTRKPPSRPPLPGAVGSAAGRRQAEVSQQSFLSRQPPAAQSRTRSGQSQNQHLYQKPQASFLHTHSSREAQLHPHSQNQTVSPQEAQYQEEGRAPFSFTFSRLYSLKGLKDKMSKLPAQSKRGSASSPGQGHKSTS